MNKRKIDRQITGKVFTKAKRFNGDPDNDRSLIIPMLSFINGV